MRKGPLAVAVVIGGLAIAFLVALVFGATPSGHHAGAVELAIQVLVLVGALLLVASRVARS
jgi:hypothetical protein